MSAQLDHAATATMSHWATVPMISVLAAVIVARLFLVSRRQLDRRVTQILIWWLFVALLRESWMQTVIISNTSMTLSDIRLLTHACVIGAAVAVYLVVRSWSLRPVETRTVVGLYGAGFVAVVVLAVLGEPARAQGIAVEELQSWHTAAYMIVYSAPMPLALFAIMKWCARLFCRANSAPSLRVGLAFVIAASCVSMYDHLTRMATGIMLSWDWHNTLTESRSQSNDVLFLPATCVIAMVLSVPAISEAKIRLRSDPSSRAVVRLQDMWQDLIEAAPKVELETEGLLHTSAEREHRMLIECEDALFLLLPYMNSAALDEDATPAERVKAISAAMRLFKDSDGERQSVAPPQWLIDENELLRVADAWART